MDEAKVAAALGTYKQCLQGQGQAETSTQESLTQLRKAIETSTFEHAGQWYQIRERKGRLYLCELDCKPKGRPKKTPEQRERDREERSMGSGRADVAIPGAGAAVVHSDSSGDLGPNHENSPSGGHETLQKSDEEGPSLGEENE